MKTTSNRRRPQNIKNWISQQPLIGSSSNFILKLRGTNTNKKCLKLRQPPMEDDLKILKIEYLSNQWSDLPSSLWKIRGKLECGSAQPSLFGIKMCPVLVSFLSFEAKHSGSLFFLTLKIVIKVWYTINWTALNLLHILFDLVYFRLHVSDQICTLPGNALKVPMSSRWVVVVRSKYCDLLRLSSSHLL